MCTQTISDSVKNMKNPGLFTGHDSTRGSEQEGFKMSWVGSGRIRRCSKCRVSGRVGSTSLKNRTFAVESSVVEIQFRRQKLEAAFVAQHFQSVYEYEVLPHNGVDGRT